MKNIIKKTTVFLAIIVASFVTVNLTSSTSVYARTCTSDDYTFLGLTPWYCNVEEEPTDEDQVASNVIIIANNVLSSISVVSAYLILGFVIYGGYLYMVSSGDPGKAAASRKVLTRAFIGLAIVLLANIILNGIRIALIGNQSFDSVKDGIDANAMFTSAINFAIGISGLICLIFIIIGAISYLTSAGDPSKLQKAKNTLTYAIIGLIIVGLAAGITAFVSGLIRNAGKTGYNNQTTIAKEIYEK